MFPHFLETLQNYQIKIPLVNGYTNLFDQTRLQAKTKISGLDLVVSVQFSVRGFFPSKEPTQISMQICLTLTRLKSNLNPINAVSVLNKLNLINWLKCSNKYICITKRNYWFLQNFSKFYEIKTWHNLFTFSDQ